MYYTAYAPENHITGHAKTLKGILAKLPTSGPFCILRRQTKKSVVDSGMSGRERVLLRHTMLLYPKGAKCKQYSPAEYLDDSLRDG